VSDLIIRLLIGLVVILFVSASLTLTKPVSDGGRLARKLCIANAAGWLFLLFLPSTGHPPAILIPMVLFWLANLVLLPAAGFALWTSHKGREERIPYLSIASGYVVINIVVLFVIPVAWLLRESSI